jgi:hypothetical protein
MRIDPSSALSKLRKVMSTDRTNTAIGLVSAAGLAILSMAPVGATMPLEDDALEKHHAWATPVHASVHFVSQADCRKSLRTIEERLRTGETVLLWVWTEESNLREAAPRWSVERVGTVSRPRPYAVKGTDLRHFIDGKSGLVPCTHQHNSVHVVLDGKPIVFAPPIAGTSWRNTRRTNPEAYGQD